MKLHQRWTPWWMGIPMLIAYLGFGWLLIRGINQPNEYVRVVIPPFLLLGWLVLPAALMSAPSRPASMA